MAEYFRANAGIVVFNKNRQVLLCQRNDVADSWQFPQGGIDAGETPLAAAYRELAEETSLTSVVPVKTLEQPIRYRFPPDVIAAMRQRGYNNVGQEMYWTLFYFTGDDSEINLHTAEPEFCAYRWGSLAEACELIVEFKKNVYRQMSAQFAPLIDTFEINK